MVTGHAHGAIPACRIVEALLIPIGHIAADEGAGGAARHDPDRPGTALHATRMGRQVCAHLRRSSTIFSSPPADIPLLRY